MDVGPTLIYLPLWATGQLWTPNFPIYDYAKRCAWRESEEAGLSAAFDGIDDDDGLSTGEIVVVTVGCVTGLLLILATLFVVYHRQQ